MACRCSHTATEGRGLPSSHSAWTAWPSESLVKTPLAAANSQRLSVQANVQTLALVLLLLWCHPHSPQVHVHLKVPKHHLTHNMHQCNTYGSFLIIGPLFFLSDYTKFRRWSILQLHVIVMMLTALASFTITRNGLLSFVFY